MRTLGAALPLAALLLTVQATRAAAAREDEAVPQKIEPPATSASVPQVQPNTGNNALEKAPSSSVVLVPKLKQPNAPHNALGKIAQPESSSNTPTERASVAEAAVPLLMQMLTSGHLTVEDAWKKKQLSVEQASFILEKEVGILGELLINGDRRGAVQPDPVRRAVAELLVQHDERFNGVMTPESPEYSQHEKQQLQQLQKSPRRVRLWVGEYLLSQNEARGEIVLKSLFDESQTLSDGGKQADGERQTVAMVAAEILSDVYHRNGSYQRSAALWLRMDKLVDLPDWKADLRLEAAHDYAQMGELQKAKELYAEVPKYGVDYFTKISLGSQIYHSGLSGDFVELRALMQQSLSGTDKNGAKLTELTFMARFAYSKGDFVKAREYATQAVAFRKSLPAAPQARALEGREDMAQEVLEWAEKWQKLPRLITTSPTELALFARAGDKPIVMSVSVQTFHRMKITVTSASPQVKIRSISPEPVNLGVFFLTGVDLEIAAENVNTFLTVKSLDDPALEIKVPIIIELQKSADEQETIDVITVD